MTTEMRAENELMQRISDLSKKNLKLSRIVVKQKQTIRSLEAILQMAPEVAIQYVDRDGTLFFWNQTSERLYGYQESDIIGRRIQEVFLPDAAAGEFSNALEKVWITGKPAPSAGWRICRQDGSRVFVRATAVPVLDQGVPIAICSMQVDATDNQRAEDLLMKFNRERRLRLEEKTAELISVNQTLAAKQADLQQQKADLEKLNRDLLENRKAVSVLSKTLEKKREDSEKRLIGTIVSKIMPIVEQLRQDERMYKGRPELDVMAAYLYEMTSPVESAGHVISLLSATEVQIATLIRNGLSSREIAARLHISLLTVKTHRRNIRKKLGLQHTKKNLITYLKSRMGE